MLTRIPKLRSSEDCLDSASPIYINTDDGGHIDV